MIQDELEKLLSIIDTREVYRTGQNGTAAWTTATTLTLTNMPFQPTDEDFLAVIEYGPGVPGTDPTYVYWSPDAEPAGITNTYPMSYNPATGVLTVQRGTFQAADSFIVIYSGLYSTPAAAVGHHQLGPEETKAVTVIQWDPAKLNATVIVINQILGIIGQGAVWISPVDFTAAWASATTLTLGAIPADVGVPTDVQFRGVIEWNAAGVADVYTPETHHFGYAAPTLTVAGATFTNGSQFMVIIADQQKAVGVSGTAAPTYVEQIGGQARQYLPTPITDGQLTQLMFTLDRLARFNDIPAIERMLGDAGIFHSPTDLTAAYASGTTLTLTGLPFTPTDEQFLGVIETTAAGRRIYYSPVDRHLLTFVAATGVLTVTGAAFTNGSAFRVLIAGQHKAYDSVLNALQTAELTARQQDFIDSQPVIAAGTNIPANSGWINVKGFTHIALFYNWTSGAGAGIHDLDVTMTGNPTDAGAVEHDLLDGPEGASVNGAAQNHDTSEIVDVTGYDRVIVYFAESGGTGDGTIGLDVTMMNP